jgi:hypothetical protein
MQRERERPEDTPLSRGPPGPPGAPGAGLVEGAGGASGGGGALVAGRARAGAARFVGVESEGRRVLRPSTFMWRKLPCNCRHG